jgi:hypothetical protein
MFPLLFRVSETALDFAAAYSSDFEIEMFEVPEAALRLQEHDNGQTGEPQKRLALSYMG